MRLQFKIIRKKFFKILLSMVIIISLGVALLFGLMNGVLSLRESIYKFIKENNYPDIKILTNIEDVDRINDLTSEELYNVEYRLAVNTIINKDNQILSVKAITYEDENLKDFYINEEKNNNSGYYDILVQKNQKIIDTGLYGIVRHPMYAITIILFLTIPLILNSIISFVIFLLYPIIIAKRIKNEEIVLEKNLEGYLEYEKKVKYKIIPFIW